MACYCPSCAEENWDDCESTEWVDKWDIRVLDPIDTYHPPQALEMVEMESSIDFDRLSDLLQPGLVSYTLLEALMQVHGVSTHEKWHAIFHHVQRKIGVTVTQLNGWTNGIYEFSTQLTPIVPHKHWKW